MRSFILGVLATGGLMFLAGCNGPTKAGKEARTAANDRMNLVSAQVSYDQARQLYETGQFERAQKELAVAINRFDKAQTRTIRPADVREALGRDIAYTVTNDFALMRAAIDRGVPISDIKRKSAIGKDLDVLDAGIAAVLGLER